VLASLDDLDRITGAHLAGLDDPEVGAGPALQREPLDPLLLADESLEHRARDAYARDLQQGSADAPAVSPARRVEVDALGRQVLAELTGPQLAADDARPDVEVLAGVCVDGLHRATVVLQVGDLVGTDTVVVHAHRPFDRTLVDRRALELAPRDVDGLTDVDGLDDGHDPKAIGL
jgi:hypothetical protein